MKSGVSLRIDDLPSWQNEVVDWERQFWTKRMPDRRYWDAMIDTTFAMYQSSVPEAKCRQVRPGNSVRADIPYTARHVPWYLDAEDLDEENRHYFATATRSNSWKPAGKALSAK